MSNEAEMGVSSQWWLDRRFKGLQMKDLHDKALGFYATSDLTLSSDFQQAWGSLTLLSSQSAIPLSAQQQETLMANHVILIICNPFNEAEIHKLSEFSHEIASLSYNFGKSPYLILVPHSMAPEVRLSRFTSDFQAKQNLIAMGIDGSLHGEPEGARLAMQIQARIKHAIRQGELMYKKIDNVQEEKSYQNYLRECNNTILWEYARLRIGKCIPCVDTNLPPGIPTQVLGYTVGQKLGMGTSGSVYKLDSPSSDAENGTGRVVKLVPKDTVQDFSRLKALARSIDLILFVGSGVNCHINIAQIFSILHSPTHIMYIMEDAGPSNLHKRLCDRSHARVEKRQPFPLKMVESVFSQASAAIHDLHSRLAMCHRDIKPENIIIKDTAHGLLLKLVDFDLATLCKADSKCKSLCGTMPFVAPEVVLEKEYDGRKSDMWSLGITFMEVLCGVRIIEEVLRHRAANDQISNIKSLLKPRKANMDRIVQAFDKPDSVRQIVQHYCLDELSTISSNMAAVVSSLVHVNVKERWSSFDLLVEVDMAWGRA